MARRVLTATATVGRPLLVAGRRAHSRPAPGGGGRDPGRAAGDGRRRGGGRAHHPRPARRAHGGRHGGAVFYAGTTVEVTACGPLHRRRRRAPPSVHQGPLVGAARTRLPARWPAPNRRRPTSRPAASSPPAAPTGGRTATQARPESRSPRRRAGAVHPCLGSPDPSSSASRPVVPLPAPRLLGAPGGRPPRRPGGGGRPAGTERVRQDHPRAAPRRLPRPRPGSGRHRLATPPRPWRLSGPARPATPGAGGQPPVATGTASWPRGASPTRPCSTSSPSPAGWLDRYPNELSGGEIQRIAVARALLARPRFVVADEISAMLDPITQAQLWHVLLRRVQSGEIGILAISHDDALLAAVADRRLDASPDGTIASLVPSPV